MAKSVIPIRYPKINSIYKRETEGPNKGKFKIGEYSCPEFSYLAETEWLFTEKIDGMNIRVMWDGEKVYFGGRTNKAILPDGLLSFLTQTFTPDRFKNQPPMIMFGEGVGPKIQGSKYGDYFDLILFDVKIDRWWLRYMDVLNVAMNLGLPVVPPVGHGTLDDMVDIVANEVPKSCFSPKIVVEGIVAQPIVQLLFRKDGNPIKVKAKVKDFA